MTKQIVTRCNGFLLSFLLFFSVLVRAEIVDTYQFKNTEDRVRAVELAKSLRCPQCQNQNLVESNSPIAYDLRIEVYKMVDEGKSNQEIVNLMTSRFGNFVLYNPPLQWTTAALWSLPAISLLFALGLMLSYAKKRSKQVKAERVLNKSQQDAIERLLKQTEQMDRQE